MYQRNDLKLIILTEFWDHRKNDTKKIQAKLVLNNFQYVKKNLFYKEIKLTEEQKNEIEKTTKKLNLINRRYFLSFNPELAYLSDKHRRERVNAFKDWIEEYNKELSQALMSRKQEAIEKVLKKEAYTLSFPRPKTVTHNSLQ